MSLHEHNEIVRSDLIFQYEFEKDYDANPELLNALRRVIQHYSTVEEYNEFLQSVAEN